MTLSQAQLLGLNKMIGLNSGTLSIVIANTTYTATVYKSAYKDNNRTVDGNAFFDDFDNLFVMARTDDVSGWNLKPETTEVTLDGTKYMTGKTITVNGPATTIWLRKRRL